MCTGKCAKFIGIALFPLCVISIVGNVILFFPGWETEPIRNPGKYMTPEVIYLGGIIGGGLMVLVPAIHIQATGREGCCNNRCGMFLSIIFAAIGVAGSLYAFVISVVGMVKGPQCQYVSLISGILWGRPFDSELEDFNIEENYLFHQELWNKCIFPKDVVLFNIVLFSIVIVSSGISLILCTVQVINGLFGCLCGTCRKNEA
ncbi:transmembrane 4 L6 family member 4-like [Bufo bufo]|uniref:transmembrane 4 L6 family member 4-like n=1 Tax=Bufo bufo TaxID=8384 RepID=UPI001ABE857E|nr:transmembrane 4 L6 family member 4-like [Bufo bufo]